MNGEREKGEIHVKVGGVRPQRKTSTVMMSKTDGVLGFHMSAVKVKILTLSTSFLTWVQMMGDNLWSRPYFDVTKC